MFPSVSSQRLFRWETGEKTQASRSIGRFRSFVIEGCGFVLSFSKDPFFRDLHPLRKLLSLYLVEFPNPAPIRQSAKPAPYSPHQIRNRRRHKRTILPDQQGRHDEGSQAQRRKDIHDQPKPKLLFSRGRNPRLIRVKILLKGHIYIQGNHVFAPDDLVIQFDIQQDNRGYATCPDNPSARYPPHLRSTTFHPCEQG
jgi:hypothetical protein